LKRFVLTLVTAALVALVATPAHAALIRLTPTGFTPAQYEAAGFPTDPAIIGSDGFRLTYWGNGGEDLANPVMLIVALPTATTAPALTVGDTSGVTTVNGKAEGENVTAGGTNIYGGNWDPSTGAVANPFNSTIKGSVYDFIGFTPSGNSSESYANWNKATGITSWNLFVYSLSFNPTMTQGDYVEFATSLPIGSFVVGYGCEALTTSGQNCSGRGTTESTPFTFAGNVAQVPEPASVTLMLSGIGMAFARARRRRA